MTQRSPYENRLWVVITGLLLVLVACVGPLSPEPPPAETLFDYVVEMMRGQGYLICLDDTHFVHDDPLLSAEVTLECDVSYTAVAHLTPGAEGCDSDAGIALSLFVTLSLIHDEQGLVLGIVVVLDDYTQLVKVQRMSAWRETTVVHAASSTSISARTTSVR